MLRKLRNGARVVVQTTPRTGAGAATVAIQLWVLAGTADEGAREHGCAHLLEHMLFKPLDIDGRRVDIASHIEALGGDVNAFTSHDETVFHATVPVRSFSPALRALVRPIALARPAAADLAQEAEVVLEEIKQYDDDPAARSMQDMIAGLFGGHDYARPVLGTAREVAGHRAATLRRFLDRNYGGDRLALVVAGPVAPAKVVAAARSVLGEFAARPRPRGRQQVRAPRGPSVVVRRDDVHEAHLSLGWQAPEWPALEACALEVASNALGYGDSCWLAAELRRRAGLVTDAHASLFAGRQASTFAVSAHGPAETIERATLAMLDMIERLRTTMLDGEELARARAVLESDVVYRRETVHGLAHAIGYHLSLGDDLGLDDVYLARVAALTPALVRDACVQWLAPARASLAIVVPKQAMDAAGARALQRRLERRLAPPARRARASRVRRDRHGFALAELPGGLVLRMAPDPSLPMIAGWLVWPGGQRTEPARHAGAMPLAAALLTRGTALREGDVLAREIEGRAAVLDGVSGRNSAALHFECLAKDGEVVLDRMLECAMRPRFAADELVNERRIALDDLRAERDDLAGLAFQAASAAIYGKHPYGRRRRGTAETLPRIDAAVLHGLWRERYPIGRACLGLCGDFDPAAITELLAARLAEQTTPPPAFELDGPRPPALRRPQTLRVRRRREQAHVVMAWPGLTLGDPLVPTMEVLTSILGGQAGRLFVALREEEGLVYHTSASSSEGLDAGHVAFYAASSPDKLVRAKAALERERDRICAERATAEELERAQAWLIGQADAALQRRGRVASLLAFDETYGLGYAAHLRYAERIARVSAADVHALARRVLQATRQVTVVVSG